MGRNLKSQAYFPADTIRFKAFAHHIANHFSAINTDGTPNINMLLDNLFWEGEPLNISEQTLKNWFSGVDKPSPEKIEEIEKLCDSATTWLVRDLEVSPMHRLLCSIDLWGCKLESANRRIEGNEEGITVGSALISLSKKWAPRGYVSENGIFFHPIIPHLSVPVQSQIFSNCYVVTNPITLLDFMLMLPMYLSELNEKEFYCWAMDLVSMTLIVCAHIESLSIADIANTGRTNLYARHLYNIFFRGNGSWPSAFEIELHLKDFPEIIHPSRLAQSLMKVRNLLSDELLKSGTSLNIIEIIFKKIPTKESQILSSSSDREMLDRHEYFRLPGNKSIRITDCQYLYIFRNVNDQCLVSFQTDALEEEHPLLPRPDLDDDYLREFSWGYVGGGARFLSKSILAHHLGHDNFQDWEVNHLLDCFLKEISCESLSMPHFLTSGMIEDFLTTNP